MLYAISANRFPKTSHPPLIGAVARGVVCEVGVMALSCSGVLVSAGSPHPGQRLSAGTEVIPVQNLNWPTPGLRA